MTTTNDTKKSSLPNALANAFRRTPSVQARGDRLAMDAAGAAPAAGGPGRARPLSKSAVKKAEKKDTKRRESAESRANAAARWHHERKWGFASRLGFYDPAAPGVESSTRQMEFSHMAIASPPTSHRGLVFGVDAGSGWMIVHDPFTAYGETIESPNVCYIGDLGQGKSSAMKTWGVLRQLILGRRVVVIDKKFQKDLGAGEYTPLARRLDVAPVRFRIGGGGSRINILDPRIAARVNEEPGAGADDDRSTPAGQSMLLRAVMEEALARPMSPKEGKAVRMAHRQALRQAAAAAETAHIGHVLHALYTPDPAAAGAAGLTVEELRGWGQDPAFELERMIEDDLAGLIDGPTSQDIALNAGLTVFDVSALPEDGPALPIVMTIINTWLANTLYGQQTPVPTILLIEEAWHTVQGSVATVTRRNTKLSRALSLSCQFAFHHISDIPETSPAISMLKECGTVLLYKQQKSADALACEDMFNLPPGSAGVISQLVKGTCLFKIGSHDPFEAIHVRSPLETELTNTDGAMKSTSTIAFTDDTPATEVVPA
ncbi:ATP/GTP-binding protein (plasmid) [Paenarthrobacter sp. AT5]|uniref:ATP/GTP-binding protein n=1 Tax=Paenarthrobacter TaxID=1742992 RepID=UPI0003977C5A|nr:MULTISPECIES: ATP/GTP-binding protein [Paenarthrobacter]MCY0975681.1 ATP/GTP-binding protein [Paenarthrobacter ureafaciens]WOC63371.1 ATP/GTP-binding protein [Paenarthrobacter sp. AT5]